MRTWLQLNTVVVSTAIHWDYTCVFDACFIPMAKLASDNLLAALRSHPRSSVAELCSLLGNISASTLTHTMSNLDDEVVRRGELYRIRHALRRPIRGMRTSIPLYRIDELGLGTQVGLLDGIYPEGTALQFNLDFDWPLIDSMQDGWFEGLPYPLVDIRPQGFLGRNFARNRAMDFQVSENPDHWSDDDLIHVLSIAGYDQPGNLILGETAYQRFLESSQSGAKRYLRDEDVVEAYPKQAETALAKGNVGFAVGGEFPKFTASRLIDDQPTEVLVKFSAVDASPASQRWSDLLVCEHLALETVAKNLGIAAANSQLYRFADQTFLEVQRFDRHGSAGRSPVCSLSSLNAALIGMMPAPWPKVACRLLRNQWLSAQDFEAIEKIWWFGRLIANTDMHEGNLAFRPGLKLAPIYDMLPMMYAPARGGEILAKDFKPDLPLLAEAATWRQVVTVANQYWNTCAQDMRISPEFREICQGNADKTAALMVR